MPPADAEIAARIAAVGAARRRARAATPARSLDEEIVDRYLDTVAGLADDGPRDLDIVYTPLHGVGGTSVAQVLETAGFAAPRSSRSRSSPTRTSRPSPSPTRRSRARWTSRWRSPSAAAPTSWSPTTPTPTGAPPPSPARTAGGCCAATRSARCSRTHLLAPGKQGTYAARIVSSSPARARWRPPPASRTPRRSPASSGSAGSTGLAFGYEEALGYCVDPEHVKDKDGVSALLLLCELAAAAKAAGRTPRRPARRHRRSSTACTPPTSSRCGSPTSREIAAAMDAAAQPRPPTELGGLAVERVDDLAAGQRRPAADRRAALPARRRRPGDRAAERHRAEAEVLPRGRRPGGPRGRRRRRPDRRRRPAGRAAQRHQGRRRASRRQPGQRRASERDHERRERRRSPATPRSGVRRRPARLLARSEPLRDARARSRALLRRGRRSPLPRRTAWVGLGRAGVGLLGGSLAVPLRPARSAAACSPIAGRDVAAARPRSTASTWRDRPPCSIAASGIRTVSQHVAHAPGRRAVAQTRRAQQRRPDQHGAEATAPRSRPERRSRCRGRRSPTTTTHAGERSGRATPVTRPLVGVEPLDDGSSLVAGLGSVTVLLVRVVRSIATGQPYAGSVTSHPHHCHRPGRASDGRDFSDITVGRSLRRFLHGLPGVDQVGAEARAAGLGTRSIKTTAKAYAHRPRDPDGRPDHARGPGHPRQGPRAVRQGDAPRPGRPDLPAGRRGLRLPRHGRDRQGGPRRHRRPRRRRRHRLPERPRRARHQARRHPRRGRGRRRRDRHGDRPRRVPLRPLPAGLRRDRRGHGGLRPPDGERAPTSR